MPDPMWRRIAEDLRQKIMLGELGTDGPIPSELELRDMYDASRNTVRDAVKLLVAQGLVVTRPGQGTFVTQKVDPFVTILSPEFGAGLGAETSAYRSEVAARKRVPEVSRPQVEIQLAGQLVAEELEVEVESSVVSRHQRRHIDGVPWSLQTTFYPMALVTQGATQLIMAEDMTEGTVRYIEATLGIRHAGWRDRITVRMPDRDEAQFFGLPDDGRVAVFEIIRTGYDDQSKPFRVTVTSYPTDRNQFVMNYGTAPAAQRWDQPDKAESDPGRAPSATRNGASSATDV